MQAKEWGSQQPLLQYCRWATPKATGSSALSVGLYVDPPRAEKKGTEQAKKERVSPYQRQAPICTWFSKEGCSAPECTYHHVCLDCHSVHNQGSQPFRKGRSPMLEAAEQDTVMNLPHSQVNQSSHSHLPIPHPLNPKVISIATIFTILL